MEFRKSTTQIILTYLGYIFIAFVALGSFLDSVSNAVKFLSPKISFVATIAIIIIWLGLEVYTKKKGIFWKTGTRSIRITGLNTKLRFFFISLILSFWLPIILNSKIPKENLSEIEDSSNSSYSKRITDLNEIQDNLKELEVFVESQKEELLDLDNLVKNLKTEQEELKPIVEADEKLVQSLISKTLGIQQQQYKKEKERDKWIERGIGFFVGIISSLVASFLYQLGKNYFDNKNEDKETENNTVIENEVEAST